MAEKVFSAVVQEVVSKGVSFLLGRRVEEVSQGNIMERLEMAINNLELALERSAKLPITDISLLKRRKMIKCAYVEAMELLDKHKQEAVPASQGQMVQRLKRKRSWIIRTNNGRDTSSLSTDDVRRFEWFADCASKFTRDVESGCSLRQFTFCNPSIRHLLEGKTLRYLKKQGNLLRHFYIWPTCSEERGVEAVLGYRYEDSAMEEKCFFLLLVLRLSENIDIVRLGTKGLQFLTSQFKLAAESATGELTLLPALLQDTAHSYVPPCVGIQEWYAEHTQHYRPDPACCKETGHGIFGNNSESSELPHIFLEQLIYLGFQCYVSSGEVGRTTSSRGWTQHMALATVAFTPHSVHESLQDNYAVKTIRNTEEHRDGCIRQVTKIIKSDTIKCMLCLPELKNQE